MRDLSDCTVLLVDDNRANISLLVEALKDSYQLGFALDGEGALRYVSQRAPDLILLDIMMPGLDGYEVCRRLRAAPATRDVPVIFCSTMDEARSKTQGFEAGAVDYITKPFDVSEVKARVKTHLSLRMAHMELARQRDRMQQSLDLAMEVQQNLLPRKDPEIDGLDVSGRSEYCDETGGDYYDYLPPADGSPGDLCLVVGDVSEHGIPSALFMTTARAFLRQRASMPGDLGRILTDVNWQLCRDMGESGQFMTLFLCLIDRKGLKIRWANAGHDPALLYDASTGRFDALAGGGPALGIVNDFAYTEYEAPIEPGRLLVLGTDGIWETRNRRGEMFGRERMKQVISQYAGRPAGEIVDAVLDAAREFRRPMESMDDATLVVVGMAG